MGKHKHGLSGTALYRVWHDMKTRCYWEKGPKYARYGGRGIKVCDTWRDSRAFFEWALANGYQEGLQIDRVNNDGDYTPTNCRFVTNWENARNRGQCTCSNTYTCVICDEPFIVKNRKKGTYKLCSPKCTELWRTTMWQDAIRRTHAAGFEGDID